MTKLKAPARNRTAAILLFVAVICSAVVFGLTLAHVLQDPGSRGLDGPAWLRVQHTFYGGFAVVGGIGEVAGLVAAAALAAVAFARRKIADGVRAGIAALALLGTLLAYFFGNRPVNSLVADWTAGSLPADWSAYRNSWEAAHALSAVLAGAAFVLLLISAVRGAQRSGDGDGHDGERAEGEADQLDR